MGEPAKTAPLSMTTIAKDNAIYDEVVNIPVHVGDQEYTIQLHPYFSNTKVREMIEELRMFIVNSSDENIELNMEQELHDIIGYFMVRHFSNIKMTTSKKAKRIFAEYRQALDSDVFKVIIRAIPKESIQKVYQAICELQELYVSLEKQMQHLQAEYEKKTAYDQQAEYDQ